ncbi:MAG: uracil-DNA glycosylase family protein [Alphaproteobacteria bacterium]|nr:uracil-DNA glycosylase family protein [Alphaproteobacteria bacterium]
MAESLAEAAAAARACTLCTDLPLGPRPILRVSPTARLLIIGQAPGTAVHASGIPWDDPSGERLRAWTGIAADVFYDETRVAILPMGLCYPGRLPNGGDAPPRPICAPTWHPRLLPLLGNVQLTLAIGGYAINRLIGSGAMTSHVAAWRTQLPARLPLPHPSWRTIGWERRNPWFAAELLPELRARLRAIGM